MSAFTLLDKFQSQIKINQFVFVLSFLSKLRGLASRFFVGKFGRKIGTIALAIVRFFPNTYPQKGDLGGDFHRLLFVY